MKGRVGVTAQLPCPDWNAPLNVASVAFEGAEKARMLIGQ